MEDIRITSAAIKQIKSVTTGTWTTMRIRLRAGGCAGFEYMFSLEKEPDEADIQIAIGNKSTLAIDPESFKLMNGSVLDYKTETMSQMFTITNPNLTNTCGCGQSVG